MDRTWPGDLAILTPRVIFCQTRDGNIDRAGACRRVAEMVMEIGAGDIEGGIFLRPVFCMFAFSVSCQD
jgi:hypothetical protein